MIVIIKGCGHNLTSIGNAVKRLGYDPVMTDDPEVIAKASRIILPGVGHAAGAMRRLQQKGLARTLQRSQQPLLGICLGMQLLYEGTEEADITGLGRLSGWVKALQPAINRPLPHMGWNQLYGLHHTENALGDPNPYVYYVHSYAAPITSQTVAWSTYGREFTAIAQSGPVMGMQFHPEKSSLIGERLLQRFLMKGEL